MIYEINRIIRASRSLQHNQTPKTSTRKKRREKIETSKIERPMSPFVFNFADQVGFCNTPVVFDVF